MASSQRRSRTFEGMSYREAQRANTHRRAQLSKADQQWLKQSGYTNVGWDNVIRLYQKLVELLAADPLDDSSLEALFLEADRIGNQYLTNEEIADFNRQLAEQVNEVAEIIDRQFPDTEIEVIDFGKADKKSGKPRHQKTYRTTKR